MLIFLLIGVMSIALYIIVYVVYTCQKECFNSDDGSDSKENAIVISRYKEKLDYLDTYPFTQYPIIIYNKGNDDTENVINLPNIGREGHTYLHHIIENYANLANVTIFLPGSCLDSHKKQLTLKVFDLVKQTNTTVFVGSKMSASIRDTFYDFVLGQWIGTNYTNTQHNYESTLQPSSIRPYGKWYEENFNGRDDVNFVSYLGIFAVAKKHILQHPKSYYEKLIKFVDKSSNPEAGHYLERSWCVIFQPFPKTCFYPS